MSNVGNPAPAVNPKLPGVVYSWINNIQALIYPPRCALCDAPGAAGLDLCPDCRDELPWLAHACQHCAVPLPAAAPAVCPDCRRRPPAFDAGAAALRYESPADWLVLRLKYQRHLSHARILGRLLAERSQPLPRPDALLPVPLHPDRRRERGFNQSAEIAAATGAALGIPVYPRLARRERATKRQADLPARRRRANVRGAFRAGPGVAGLTIAIVDDVATTGHTAAELARTLRHAGAAGVQLWVAARA